MTLKIKSFTFGRLGRLIDSLPTREAWFCLYQPHLGGTAYLYEYDSPIDNEVYVKQLAPELRQRFGRPARDCYLHVVHGESFGNCDVARPPWYCYQLLLSGMRVGQRLGPYAADDVVAPNRVTLPLQERWRNNIRDVRDIVDFLAVPSEARLAASMRRLVAVAHQDGWRSGPAVVHLLLTQRWGHQALQMHGITAAAIRQAYALYADRLRQDGAGGDAVSSGWEGGSGGGGRTAAAAAASAERRAARRRPHYAAATSAIDVNWGDEEFEVEAEGLGAHGSAAMTATAEGPQALAEALASPRKAGSDKSERWRRRPVTGGT